MKSTEKFMIIAFSYWPQIAFVAACLGFGAIVWWTRP